MEMKKAETLKFGKLTTKEYEQDGAIVEVPSIELGESTNKDPKYNYSVELIVRDSNGNAMLQLDSRKKRIFVKLYKPHEKAPKYIRFELKLPKE
jgi:hypothetical protein